MGRKYDLAIFDMDGTLTTNRSSWAYVHEYFGVSNEEAYQAFCNMEIDEAEFMRRDIGLWMKQKPGITALDVAKIMTGLPLTKGIQETVAALHYNNIKCVICSGGLDSAARMLTREFGFDGFLSDELETDENGVLTGEGIRNVDLRDKGASAEKLMKEFGAAPERTFAVGNSFGDVSMFDRVGMSIAFNPTDEWTAGQADHVVRSDNISDILEFVFLVEVEDGI